MAGTSDEAIGDDMLRGAGAIAEALRVLLDPETTERQASHLAKTHAIPAFMFGSRWCVRRSVLRAFLREAEQGGLTATNAVRRARGERPILLNSSVQP